MRGNCNSKCGIVAPLCPGPAVQSIWAGGGISAANNNNKDMGVERKGKEGSKEKERKKGFPNWPARSNTELGSGLSAGLVGKQL